MKTNDIFISYSTKNKELAYKIKNYLQSKGVKCWMAPESIQAGSNYTKEIPYGIRNSKIALLILSKEAVKSVWVGLEVNYLLHNSKIVIPIIVDDIRELKKELKDPFLSILKENENLKYEDDLSLLNLLKTVKRKLNNVVNFVIPEVSDDYLQLGLKDLNEDGGMLFDGGMAEIYLKKAASLGNATAMRKLAELISSEREYEEAEYWWNQAEQHGDPYSILRKLENELEEMQGDIGRKITEATEIIKPMVSDNDPEICTFYAEMLLNPNNKFHTKENINIGIGILKRAIKEDYPEAAIVLGDFYSQEGEWKNETKAFKYYLIASENDLEEGVLKMADCYFYGKGVKKNLKKAFEGYADYCFFSDEYIEKYADCLNYGYGTKINKQEALEYYNYIDIDENDLDELQKRVLEKRLQLGDSLAGFIKGKNEYESGNYDKAYNYFYRSSQKGHPESLLYLGKCYLMAQGTPYQPEKAFKLFVRSFSLGCFEASSYLSQCYEYAIGINKNLVLSQYFKRIFNGSKDSSWKKYYLLRT